MTEEGSQKVGEDSALARAKGWAALVFWAITLANILIAVVWFIYMYLVPTPAREQLATTHADLVGRWTGSALRLEIHPDATVSVNKDFTHYGGKIWRFDPDRDFTLWIFPIFRGHFHVEGPPERRSSGEEWLVVDGYHLRRDRP